MRVLGLGMVERFARKHATSRKPLQRFVELAEAATWKTFIDVKSTFPATDLVAGNDMVFDIGGNNYRVRATVDFASGTLLIEKVQTHAEYSKE